MVTQLHQELDFALPTKNMSYRYAYLLGTIFEALSIFGIKASVTRMGVVLAGKDSHFSSKKLAKIGWSQTKSVQEMINEWTTWRKEFEKNRKAQLGKST
ncbi:MAG: hypothetical protein ACW99Q_30110 [Candidatus Kariarchaeaceae archaeon]